MLQALAVEYRTLDRLIPYARNAREHSPEQIAEIAGSIRTFGFANPILVGEDGEVIAGHGRLAAAQLLGLAEVPVIPLKGLSDTERRQLVLADNRIALNAGWNADLLRLELTDLEAIGADLKVLGFTEEELAEALSPGTSGLTDPDDAPEPPVNPVSRLGDLWALGAHRVLCGDATSAEDVKRACGAVCPHLMVTDPPYGVDYDPTWRAQPAFQAGRRDAKGNPTIDKTFAAKGKVDNDHRADWRDAWSLFSGSAAYVWCASLQVHVVAASLLASGFALRSSIIWEKPQFAISRGDYHWRHEPCWYAVREGGKSYWQGARDQDTVWRITSGVGFTTKKEGPDKRTGHSTQKPVECMRRPIVNNSSPGQAVYDPFLGSGTTIIAAEMEGRSCLGLEIDPAYCDVIVKRWQEFTGKEATLEGGEGTFEAVAAERKS